MAGCHATVMASGNGLEEAPSVLAQINDKQREVAGSSSRCDARLPGVPDGIVSEISEVLNIG